VKRTVADAIRNKLAMLTVAPIEVQVLEMSGFAVTAMVTTVSSSCA